MHLTFKIVELNFYPVMILIDSCLLMILLRLPKELTFL